MKESNGFVYRSYTVYRTQFGWRCKELDMEFDTADEACNYIDEIYYNEDNDEE